MLLITAEHLSRALRVAPDTTQRKLRYVQKIDGDKYPVAAVVPRLKAFHNVQAVCEFATEGDYMWAGDNDDIATKFEAWALTNPATASRAMDMQKRFTRCLALSNGSHVYFKYLNILRAKVLLSDHITKYVLTGQNFWGTDSRFAGAFALINAVATEEMIADQVAA